MKLATILLVTGGICLNLTAQVQIFDSGPWLDIRVAAQKGDGQITAAGIGGSWRAWNWNENWQPSYNNSPWNAWGSSDTAGGIPVSMESTSNGSVISLWDKKDDGSVFCLVHTPGTYSANARLTGLHGPASLARAFMDSSTNLWIVEAGLNICNTTGSPRGYRLTPKLLHTIVVDELWPDGNVTNRLPVSITEDGRGRLWFWSDCLFGDNSRGAVHGVFISDDGVITHHPTLEGVTDGRISAVAPLDKTNLWLAVCDAGIFTIDLETLKGSLVAEPESGAFRRVQSIFTEDDDIYVISGSPNDLDQQGCVSSLWRKRGGVWKRLSSGLDSCGAPEQFADRQELFTKDGLWLGAFGTGGWFFPRDDSEPRQIAWQVGSPFDRIDKWFQLKNGQMLALQFGRGALLADAVLLTAQPAKASAKILQLERPLIQTTNGIIFAIFRSNRPVLSEWNGKNWQSHSFPDDLQLWSDCVITTDAKGRVWFLDQNYNPDPKLRPTMIYDPQAGRFQRFSSLQTALQSQARTLANSSLGSMSNFQVVFSDDGRISYVDRMWQVNYFDGHEWRKWRLNDIVNGGLWGSANRVPFFNRDGKLALDLNDKVYQLDDLGGWKNTTLPAPAMADQNIPAMDTPNVPEASSIVADRRGIYWVVARKQLYRAGYGMRAAVFPPGEPEPFADGRKLTAAFVDDFGNAFLQTSLAGHEETVLVPARGQLPITKLTTREKNEDGVMVELSATGVNQPRFAWRVDDDKWSNATTNSLLRLNDLPAGSHRVEVLTLDERLQTDPKPATIEFTVRLNPEKRLPQIIAQLNDSDYTRREVAVAWLSRHQAIALPALKTALERENNADRRWWLEAAIQKCQ